MDWRILLRTHNFSFLTNSRVNMASFVNSQRGQSELTSAPGDHSAHRTGCVFYPIVFCNFLP
jgi:hypothetical protein